MNNRSTDTELREAQKALDAGDLDTVTDLIVSRATRSSLDRIRSARADVALGE